MAEVVGFVSENIKFAIIGNYLLSISRRLSLVL